MNLIADIVATQKELTDWRRDIHSHPELAFEESRTADFVANQLEAWGIDVTRGIGKTGLVGTLKVGSANKAIGLRADMDALPMDELNSFAHKSKHKGCMHGCGHDGHTVMLLAAARYLAQSKQFDGTIHFIFQPAEEANNRGSGARAMIEDGLFDRFPVDAVFALHNCPDMVAGSVATCPGAITASMDLFEVTITGQGAHGAYPHAGIDPVFIAAQLLSAWQSIITRNVNAQDSAVISATSIKAGDSWNVIPETAVIKGSVRTLSPEVRQIIQDRFHTLTHSLVEAFGANVAITYRGLYPATINTVEKTIFACDVAATIVGENRVLRTTAAGMGSEDFACMLEQRPGCYLLLGASNPPGGQAALEGKNIKLPAEEKYFTANDVPMLHEPTYDFNDDILPLGATLFARLAERYLSAN